MKGTYKILKDIIQMSVTERKLKNGSVDKYKKKNCKFREKVKKYSVDKYKDDTIYVNINMTYRNALLIRKKNINQTKIMEVQS